MKNTGVIKIIKFQMFLKKMFGLKIELNFLTISKTFTVFVLLTQTNIIILSYIG